MITLQGGTYLAHRTEGLIQQRTISGAIGAAMLLVIIFVGAGFWLQHIEGYRIMSVVDFGALPDPLGKTVLREAGAWMGNYGKQPLRWLLPALGIAVAMLAQAVQCSAKTAARRSPRP